MAFLPSTFRIHGKSDDYQASIGRQQRIKTAAKRLQDSRDIGIWSPETVKASANGLLQPGKVADLLR